MPHNVNVNRHSVPNMNKFLPLETVKFWENQRNQYFTHGKVHIKHGMIESCKRHLFPPEGHLPERNVPSVIY